ncbi:MAG: 30S ribosomal protein S4 [Vicinamibacterales bacterium]
MSRYTGPRLRIMRSLGMNLPGLSAKTIDKRPFPPGQHGPKTRRKASLHGTRLREKQKLRFHYGVTERQLRTLAAAAARAKGATGAELVQLLERRLDNIVFRAGFARTIPAARQLVTHSHVLVNDRVLNIPSARLRRGDVVTIRTRAHEAVQLQRSKGVALAVPDWLEVDVDAFRVKLAVLPDISAVPFPIEMSHVVEFYS